MNYYIITFGCQMNKSDSERIATVLEKIGYKPASKMNEGEENKFSSSPFAKAQEADLIVINMCSVRQSAVDRIFGQCQKFIKLKTKNSKLKTLLTGCILKKDLKKFKEHFDFILPIKTLELWPKLLRKEKYFYYPDQRGCEFNKKFNIDYFHISPKTQNNFSSFVPISTGCNNFCAYCVVPFVRGPLICRSHKEILKEVEALSKNRFKEIWLLGQNVNDYHSPIDSSIDFPKLLKMVNDISGNFWIRFTSPHPKDFSDELIRIMAECEKVTPYLNLPVQSGDNEVLKKMNRPYTVSQYKSLVKKIREKIPEICLSTDIIVGFPGETKKKFENTILLFQEIKYDMAYISIYSPRTETTAFKFKRIVPHHEKQRRHKILTEIIKQTALENNKKYVGKRIKVLVNGAKDGFLIGKTNTYKTVKFIGPKNLVGQFVKVRIIDALPWGLKGLLTNF